MGSSKIIFTISVKGAQTFVRYWVGCTCKSHGSYFEKLQRLTNVLSHLHSDVSEKGDTRLHANNLWQKMEKLEFVFMLHFWTRKLGRFYRISKALQESDMLLSTCAELYSSNVDFLSEIRDDFDEFDQQAKATLPNINYKKFSLGDKEMHLRL